MKIQLIVLSLFVVAVLSHGHGDDSENQVGRRRHFRGSRRNDNQVTKVQESDSDVEDSASEDDSNSSKNAEHEGGKRGCGGKKRGWGSRRRENDEDEAQEGVEG
jgi:hypothetical protein